MNRYFFFIFLSIAFIGLGQSQVQVLQSNDQSLTLEFQMPQQPMMQQIGEDWQVTMPGWGKVKTPGYPQLPTTGTVVQVPESGAVRLEIVETKSIVLGKGNIERAPQWELKEDGTLQKVPVEPVALTGFFPSACASLGQRGILRQVSVVPVQLYPVQWDPKTKAIRCITRMVLKLTWNESLPMFQEARDDFAALCSREILNYHGPNPRRIQSETMRESPGSGLKMEIEKQGIYCITYEDLANAGITEALDPQTFQVFCQGQEIPLQLHTVYPDQWMAGDFLEFHAQPMQGLYTNTNVYWLRWGQNIGQRVFYRDSLKTEALKITTFSEKIRIEQNKAFWENLREPFSVDHWFWEKITAPKISKYSIDLPNPVANQPVEITMSLRGRTTPDPHPNHHAIFSWNSSVMGEGTWNNENEFIQTYTVPHAASTNILEIKAPGDTGAPLDIFYFNWVEISYRRSLRAIQDQIDFQIQPSGDCQIIVTNFTSQNIRVWDITNPQSISEITNLSITPQGSTYTLAFNDAVNQVKAYYAFCSSQTQKPKRIAFWESTNLQNPNHAANYVIITAKEFLSTVEPLAQFHQNQGNLVKVIDVEDLYNEFSHGIFDPKAVQDFLKFAYHNWQTPPMYVLLVGSSNTDYHNYLGSGKRNFVPVYLSQTNVLGLTPNDNWFVCVDGTDDLPDMLIGRLSGQEPSLIANSIQKIIANASSQAMYKGLFVSDSQDLDFAYLSDELIQQLPSTYQKTKVYMINYTNPVNANQDILTAIQKGQTLVNYVGHGATTYWTREILASKHVPLLQNANAYSFFLCWTCLNGYFSQPLSYCLGEELLMAREKGAFAVFAFSGAETIWEHSIASHKIYTDIFQKKVYNIGTLLLQSKLYAFQNGAVEVLSTLTLLGDPGSNLQVGD